MVNNAIFSKNTRMVVLRICRATVRVDSPQAISVFQTVQSTEDPVTIVTLLVVIMCKV